MEDFLNTSRQLLDSMAHRGIVLPKRVIFTQYLNNLTDNYENIVSNIMQTLRNNIDSYPLDELFSNLLDTANRLQSKAVNSQTALVSLKSNPGKKFKSKKSYKFTKDMLCRHCHRTNHTTSDCFELFPEKVPKKFKGSRLHSELELRTRHTSDGVKNVKDNKVLVNQGTPKLINLDGMDVDPTIESVCQEFILNLQSTDLDLNLDPIGQNRKLILRQTSQFVFDTAATSHILNGETPPALMFQAKAMCW
ncbi:hypothetical protein OnM2_011030 [Erysiphe neolycopersici]|uniref:Uncharacterized protein n=1 Tax=Erysiphe neolycopersici TaxID=212602 RepID=A0A420I6D6_9PEZI|nr:hypothetical protein OnM2_011030 [Erysiphe neolycopersici]